MNTETAIARIVDLGKEGDIDPMCPTSPDKRHHFKASVAQSLVYIENGSHTCRNCVFCGVQKCKTSFWGAPDPLSYPSE